MNVALRVCLLCISTLLLMISVPGSRSGLNVLSDLIVDGTIVTLWGNLECNNVEIKNGGTLQIAPYNGTAGGWINVTAGNVTIDATSRISGGGCGYRGNLPFANGGEGPGGGGSAGSYMDVGGGGAGYGGKGGNSNQDPNGGKYPNGGPEYGTSNASDSNMGSAGGWGNYNIGRAPGGNGGAMVKLNAATINVFGLIDVRGNQGGYTGVGDDNGGGGGSGGSVVINGTNVNLNGSSIDVRGGSGGSESGPWGCGGGGGGAGGRVKVLASTSFSNYSAVTYVEGGGGGASTNNTSGESGSIGTAYYGPLTEFAEYTIATVPSDLSIIVDSVMYAAPQAFTWIVGSNHNLNVNSPQGGYLFDYWSDGSSQNHEITIGSSNVTITAYFSLTPDHDVTVSAVETSKDNCPPMPVVCVGQNCRINLTVKNNGDFTDTFNATAFVLDGLGSYCVGSQQVILDQGLQRIVAFVWNTTGFGMHSYTVRGQVDNVTDETHTVDNSLNGTTITITNPADLDGNKVIDIFDVVRVAVAFGSYEGSADWDPNANVNDDRVIDIFDITAIAVAFGNIYP